MSKTQNYQIYEDNIDKLIIIQNKIRDFLNNKKNNPHKQIDYYYKTYLQNLGVKKINKNTQFYYALEYLYLNLKKEIYIEDLKKYVESKGIKLNGSDSLQVRHLAQQYGYNILKGGDNFNDKKIKKSHFMLVNLTKPFKSFIKDKRKGKLNDENWNKITGLIKRQILHTLLEILDFKTFERKQIVDLDLRTSGIQKNKKSFLNLEITLFVLF